MSHFPLSRYSDGSDPDSRDPTRTDSERNVRTLTQWLAANGNPYVETRYKGLPHECLAVQVGPGYPGYADLFHLSDYGFSALCSGPFVELFPHRSCNPAARIVELELLLSDIWDYWAGGDVPEELGARIREALAQRAAQQGTGGNSQ